MTKACLRKQTHLVLQQHIWVQLCNWTLSRAYIFFTNWYSTYIIWHGSLRSLRQCPASHFFLVGNVVLMCFAPACVFFTPHHGASAREMLQLHPKWYHKHFIGQYLVFNYPNGASKWIWNWLFLLHQEEIRDALLQQ